MAQPFVIRGCRSAPDDRNRSRQCAYTVPVADRNVELLLVSWGEATNCALRGTLQAENATCRLPNILATYATGRLAMTRRANLRIGSGGNH